MPPPPPVERPRLDVYLVEAGLISTREKARSLILQGKVRVDGRPVTKPGTRIKPAALVEVSGAEEQPVGRGYHKLARGIERLGLEVAGRVCLDAGASTGGFTERLLEGGAARVYAVDVGYGQLAWKVRSDPRVVAMDRTNIRAVDPAEFDPRPAVLVADLSFISLVKVLPNLARILRPGSPAIALVKPQFEAGRGRVEKGGIVRDPAVHRAVLAEVVAAAAELGWASEDLCPSPIQGAKGNREFLVKFRSPGVPDDRAPDTSASGRASSDAPGIAKEAIAAAVAEAHK